MGNDLFNEILEIGMCEKLRQDRKQFIDELLHKIDALSECDLDPKELLNELNDFLNSQKKLLAMKNNRYL